MDQASPPRIHLFAYTDYRTFLRDWLEEARVHKGLSKRCFALRLGLKSTGHLHLIVSGQRNLGLKTLQRFVNGLKLAKDEKLFFQYLVFSNQAKTDQDRGRHEAKLNLLRKHRSLSPEVRSRVDALRREIAELLVPHMTSEEASGLADLL